MPSKQIAKNRRDVIKVTPSQFRDHDLIDIRIYFPNSDGELAPTKKGIAVPVDVVPELIDALHWALGQPCSGEANAPERVLSEADANKLAELAWVELKKHGSAVHWDSLERMVQGSTKSDFSKWDLHYVLTVRKDLFERVDAGCFKARGKKDGV